VLEESGNHRLRRGFIRASQWLGFSGPQGKASLSPLVVPTFPYEIFAASESITNQTITVTGDGDFAFSAVPAGEIWDVKFITYGVLSGTFTIDELFVTREDGNVDLPLDLTDIVPGVTKAFATAFNSSRGMVLYPGAAFGITSKTHSVNGSANLKARLFIYAFEPDDRF